MKINFGNNGKTYFGYQKNSEPDPLFFYENPFE